MRPTHRPTPLPTSPSPVPTPKPTEAPPPAFYATTAAFVVYGVLGLVVIGSLSVIIKKRQAIAKKEQRAADNEWANARHDREEGKSADGVLDFLGGDSIGEPIDGDSAQGGIIFALSPFSSCLNTGPREERGGRGFRGDVQADVGAFLESDPAARMMDRDYTASPLVDPRFGSF